MVLGMAEAFVKKLTIFQISPLFGVEIMLMSIRKEEKKAGKCEINKSIIYVEEKTQIISQGRAA